MKKSFATLDAVLLGWDRFSAGDLDRLAADHSPEPALLLHLVELAESDEAKLEIAATALLKRYQERGAAFDACVTARLLDLLPAARHWEATLHLLQMLAELPIPPSYADSLCESVRDLSRHEKTFVRAWAYGGLHRLATLYPEYRAELGPLLARAAREEAPSVRARLRQLPLLDDDLPFSME